MPVTTWRSEILIYVQLLGQKIGLPSGYDSHINRKSPFLIGKPSISMGHLYHGELLNNQRVNQIARGLYLQCEAPVR